MFNYVKNEKFEKKIQQNIIIINIKKVSIVLLLLFISEASNSTPSLTKLCTPSVHLILDIVDLITHANA